VALERAEVAVSSRAQWRDWLAANARTSDGCWAVTWRSGSGRPVVPYDALVEEALRVGWIDSKGRRVDAERTALLVTPRKRGSGWSRLNKERVARLEAAGLMRPSGQAVVDAARADGSWTALDAVEALEVPSDLAAALDAAPGARPAYDALTPSAKKAVLASVLLAKRPETRARRITAAVHELRTSEG
jgi:uncharacterized protein YdeI (YjbR/CyaY-like superfamily)